MEGTAHDLAESLLMSLFHGGQLRMGITASLILIAVGAILRWAVTTHTSGIDLHVVPTRETVAYVDLPLREWAKDWPFT